MTDITIPPQAINRAVEVLSEMDDGMVSYPALARAAILAALYAWPGGITNPTLGRLILPLNMENVDD